MHVCMAIIYTITFASIINTFDDFLVTTCIWLEKDPIIVSIVDIKVP